MWNIYFIYHWRIYLRENPEHVSTVFSCKNYICLVVRIDILAVRQPCKNQLLITEPEVNSETLEVRFRLPRRTSWEETIELIFSENFQYIIMLCFVQLLHPSPKMNFFFPGRRWGNGMWRLILYGRSACDTFHKDLHMSVQNCVMICWQEADSDPDSALLTLGGLWQSHSYLKEFALKSATPISSATLRFTVYDHPVSQLGVNNIL